MEEWLGSLLTDDVQLSRRADVTSAVSGAAGVRCGVVTTQLPDLQHASSILLRDDVILRRAAQLDVIAEPTDADRCAWRHVALEDVLDSFRGGAWRQRLCEGGWRDVLLRRFWWRQQNRDSKVGTRLKMEREQNDVMQKNSSELICNRKHYCVTKLVFYATNVTVW